MLCCLLALGMKRRIVMMPHGVCCFNVNQRQSTNAVQDAIAGAHANLCFNTHVFRVWSVMPLSCLDYAGHQRASNGTPHLHRLVTNCAVHKALSVYVLNSLMWFMRQCRTVVPPVLTCNCLCQKTMTKFNQNNLLHDQTHICVSHCDKRFTLYIHVWALHCPGLLRMHRAQQLGISPSR